VIAALARSWVVPKGAGKAALSSLAGATWPIAGIVSDKIEGLREG
jgi:hypothetical protein